MLYFFVGVAGVLVGAISLFVYECLRISKEERKYKNEFLERLKDYEKYKQPLN